MILVEREQDADDPRAALLALWQQAKPERIARGSGWAGKMEV
jgi:hypothetical protein